MSQDVVIKVGADIADLGRELSNATKAVGDFSKKNQEGLTDAAKAAGVFIDKNGKLRDASGKFLSQLDKTTLGLGDFEKKTTSISDRLDRFGSDMQSHGTQIAGAFGGISLAITGALGFAVKQSADFDTAIRKAGAIAGATAEDFEIMRQAAIDLGASTSLSASEVANAFTEMAARGFDATEAVAAMPGVIAAAEASGEDLALAAETVSSALNIWGLEASEAGRVADVLAMSANVSAAGINDLGYAFKYAGAPAAALGIGVEELASAIGIMTDAGLAGENAGTSLRASLLALNNPANAQQKIMDKLGLSIRDSSGEAKDLAAIIDDVKKATEGMTDAERVATVSKLVGTEAVSGFIALMNAGSDSIRDNTKALMESEGAAAATAEQMKSGIGGALEELSGAFESLAITLGDKLVPYIQKFAVFLTVLLNAFTGLNPAFQTFLVIGASVVAALTGLLAIFGTIIAFIGFVAQGIGALTALFAPFFISTTGAAGGVSVFSSILAALTGPIGWAIAGIIALGAALVLAYNKSEWFRGAVQEIWNFLVELTTTVFTAIYDLITSIISSAVNFGEGLLNKFAGFWEENGAFISDSVARYFGAVWGTIQLILGFIKGLFEILFPILKNTALIAFEGIQVGIENILDIVLGIVSAAMKLLQGDWKGAWQEILEIGTDIMNNIVGFFEDIDLYSIGSDIIAGLVKGIGSMSGAVQRKVESLANLIPRWAKDILGIASPSKVFKQIGAWTGEGLAIGLDGEVSAVKRSAQELANASIAKPALSYATPSGSYGSLSSALDGEVAVSVGEQNGLLREIVTAIREGQVITLDGKAVGQRIDSYQQRETQRQLRNGGIG